MRIYGQISELVKVIWRKATGYSVTLEPTNATVGDATVSIPDPEGASRTLVTTDQSQTLTNKTLDGGTLTGTIAGSPTLSGTVTFTNAPVLPSGAVTREDIAAGTANHVVINDGTGALSSESKLAVSRGGTNSSTALNNNRIMVSSGGAIVEAAALTDGQLLIGSSGNPPSVNTITGTTNRVIVSNAPGSITLSTPQDIATTSQPTFDRINVRNGSQQLLLGDATNWMSITASSGAAPRQFTIPNPDSGTTGTFAILERAQTFTGTITLSSTISTGNISFDSTKGIESRTSGGTLNVGTGGNTSTLNLGSGDSVATINVGTGTSAATVNIGNSSADTINLSGTLNVQDKNILLNDGGAASSGDGSGLDVEENNAVTGYARVGDTRTAWDFKAPANAGFIRLKTGPQNAIISATGLLAARTYTLPDATGTFGLVPTSGVVKSNGTALTSGSVNLASEVSGVLPTANGGTGVNGTATYPSTGTVVTAEGSATLSLKTLQDALYQGIRLVDNNVTAAGPSFAVSNTVSIYRVKSGFGATLSTITSGNDGTFIFVVNETGGDLTITNNAGTNGLYTGTGSNLVLQNNSAVACVYDTTNARWNITGGGGGGGPAILPIASGGTNSGTALLNNRVMISSGGAIIEASAIQADRALVSNAQGIPVASAITLTELNRLTGVSSDIQTQLDGKQASDADLTALAGLTSTGLIVRTGAGTAATRSLAAGTGKISISNVDGVAGNPTIDVVEGNLTHNNIGGILGLAKGGTNANITPAAGAIVFSTATALGVTAAGTAGQPLISNGTSTPTWFSGTGFVKATTGVLSTVSQVSLTTEVTGTLPVANGGTGSTTSTGSAGSAVVLATSPTITDAQLSSVRLTDTTISTAGPAFTVGTSTTYRLLSGFGSTLSTISGGQDGDFIIIVNETNNDLTITNNAGVNGLFTGTGANLIIQNSAAVTGVYDSGNQRWNLISGGGAGGLRTSVVTGNTNAVAGVHYLVNNTAAVTITLPASPQTGAVIRVSDLKGTCGTNNITIARNGQLIDGQAENFVLDVNNGWAQLMWAGGSEGWTVDTLAVSAQAGVLSLNGVSGDTYPSQSFATGTTGTDFNISSSTNTHTFNIPDASATARGLVTTGTQTLAGDKSFTGNITFDTDTLFVDATNNRVGVGTTSPTSPLTIVKSYSFGQRNVAIEVKDISGTTGQGYISPIEASLVISTGGYYNGGNGYQLEGGQTGFGAILTSSSGLEFRNSTGEVADSLVGAAAAHLKFKIDQAGAVTLGPSAGGVDHLVNGDIGVGRAASAARSTEGAVIFETGFVGVTRNGDVGMEINRLTSDGNLFNFYQAGTLEGAISVSGTTVSYGGGHLARWSQFDDKSKPNIKKGTLMSSTGVIASWDGETNEQLTCSKVSDVVSDKTVAGIFQEYDDNDYPDSSDFWLAQSGDYVIRIKSGVTVQVGDLLESAGDGTARPQADDIVRASTVAKVMSSHASITYEDGSYCVPCLLML